MTRTTEVRLLTFNALMRGDVRARLRALGAVLAQSSYDVVCLQEVLLRGHASLVRRLARHYGHRAWSGSVLLEGGLVLLSRWPIRTARFERYPRTGPARAEYLMRKGVQLAVVETPAGPLAITNTHLSANRDGDWSAANRYTRVARAELDHLAGELAALDPALPVVAVGDFNVPRDAATLTGFLTRTGLTDVLAGDPEPTYRPTPRWPAPPAFDHVLIRPAPRRPLAAQARIVLRDAVTLPGGRAGYLSDHYGVEAVLSVGG
ncbi:endonuclease/exonuclease/phosphatase family protein [Actinoplanes sp. NPDC004185]